MDQRLQEATATETSEIPKTAGCVAKRRGINRERLSQGHEKLDEESEIRTGRFMSLITVDSWAYRGEDRLVASQHVLFREWISTHIPRPP